MGSNRAGGIVILISLCLPTFFYIYLVIEFYWLFGLRWSILFGFRFFVNLIGILLTVILLVLIVLCFKREPDKTRILAILSLVLLVVYYIIALFVNLRPVIDISGYRLLPLGFFGIVIGAILVIVAKS